MAVGRQAHIGPTVGNPQAYPRDALNQEVVKVVRSNDLGRDILDIAIEQVLDNIPTNVLNTEVQALLAKIKITVKEDAAGAKKPALVNL